MPKGWNGKADIAVLVMHSDEDYLSFSAGEELAERGFTVMCANCSSKTSGLDQRIRDMRTCFNYLKDNYDPRRIILLGHSGGATLASAYQSIAEKGPSIYQNENMIWKCSDDLTDLTPADGLMLLDSNWGNGAMCLFSLDPAVADESDSHVRAKEFDLYDPDNGFTPGGTTYPESFVKTFFRGQHERSTRLTEYALSRVAAIDAGKGSFDDDEPFVIAGFEQAFFNNKLYAQDIRFMSVTKEPHLLLHKDGAESVELVRSLRGPENDTCYTTYYADAAQVTTVKNYLSLFAVRTTEEYGFDESNVYGIDWDASYNCTTGNIKHVSCPTLVMGMTGGWEFAASETIYNNSESTDKTLAYVEGADHFFRPCKHLEKVPGQFGDTIKTTYDFVDNWIRARF
ncbi:MAG: alpha/beta hydrolase [Lachnospiraceae bacterium]|nr:alpha/beta hydrolase [Lachnospiraceae bacterium]